MDRIAEFLEAGLSFFPNITFAGVIEILILAYIIYVVIKWMMNTRAWTLLMGLLLILAFTIVAVLLHFNVILWLLGRVAAIAVTAIVIIFQPELRRALEQLGRRNIFKFIFDGRDGLDMSTQKVEKTIDEIIKAVFEMSKPKTGALIVIEGKEDLSHIASSGITINGLVSSQLLINIFEHNTPLHDGAVLIRGNQIIAATCYLPLSDSTHISKDLGTRHRAAVGISEASDAVTIVVSEETGGVSVSVAGYLKRVVDEHTLRSYLSSVLISPEIRHKYNWRALLKGRGKDEK